ncbi:highly divergent homeobox [Gouania willdenowi]|uniref:Homeobox domain-containing protein n=1 Tax=Gouania willdenowi TaxID=441366 RepID=A0A8C5H7E2_GOUWI|nr:highly divergent homeobox [Gouania willdenowi]
MCTAAPLPSSSRMDAWSQRRGLQTMNLRSVFTNEQQRILERYYENGMTNQSKACFQLILQCAQEAKLDFSVVRTWVGNKRRKVASRVDQNGGVSHSLSSHGLAGGLLSNHTLAGGSLSNHSLVAGGLLSADLAAARNLQNRVHVLPPSSSFPSFSSASSSSPSSPLNSNKNTSSDVILTGMYSMNSVSRPRPKPPAPPSQSDSDLSAHTSSSMINQIPQSRNSSTSSPVHSKLVSLSQNLPSLTSASGPIVYTAVRKSAVSLGEGGTSAGTGVVPHSWARQYGTLQIPPWSPSLKPQTQQQPRPHSNPEPQLPASQNPRLPLAAPDPNPSEKTPRIQEVFTLSAKGEADPLKPAAGRKTQERHRTASSSLDTCHNFSIAMETGNVEDEWQREEELARLAAQTHIHRERTSTSPVVTEVSSVRGNQSPLFSSRSMSLNNNNNSSSSSSTVLQDSYALTAQTSHTGECSTQTQVSVLSPPWIISNSRKRTLQDRTQFSDGDLIQLKRYWDRGMTSLGSVCREKITAAANQLSVDTEIVKTWISNRRRKYRLMGIEIPPPKGGPAVFLNSSPGDESPLALSPDEDLLRMPDDDLNDEGSVCLSEDGTIDSQQRDGEDASNVSAAPLANNVKIEIYDEDEEANENDDNNGEFVTTDVEQMQNMLEFKHEEVQFLEHELENQKQKYLELVNFTKSLLYAVKNKDVERQQELVAILPQPSEEDWDVTVERGTLLDAESGNASGIHDYFRTTSMSSVDSSPTAEKEKDSFVALDENVPSGGAEPSASEEQLQKAEEE